MQVKEKVQPSSPQPSLEELVSSLQMYVVIGTTGMEKEKLNTFAALGWRWA